MTEGKATYSESKQKQKAHTQKKETNATIIDQ